MVTLCIIAVFVPNSYFTNAVLLLFLKNTMTICIDKLHFRDTTVLHFICGSNRSLAFSVFYFVNHMNCLLLPFSFNMWFISLKPVLFYITLMKTTSIIDSLFSLLSSEVHCLSVLQDLVTLLTKF